MKYIAKWVALAALGASLGGCFLAPGQHMDTRALEDSSSASAGRIELVPITPKLIAQEDANRPDDAIPPALLHFKPAEYTIGAGDQLYITVWDHPELTAPSGPQQQIYANGRLVRPDGTLFYPYVGQIHAAGMTLEQLRERIASKLAKYIEKPQVDISIIQYASQKVWLNGAFLHPGSQPITVTPLTLGQALGTAKVDPANADLSHLVLRRDGHDYTLDLYALQHGLYGPADIDLKAGDHIYLGYNDRQQVYVMGEVGRPQALTFRTARMSLSKALGETGGLNQTTSRGKSIYVIRGVKKLEDTPSMVFQLDAKSPAAFALADNFQLHPGDIVFVGAAGITRWNRFVSQMLPLSVLLNSTTSANKNLQ